MPSCRSENFRRVPKRHPATKTLDLAMLSSYLLHYRNYCVIIGRAHLPPKRGGCMHHAACVTKTYAPRPRPFARRTQHRQDSRARPTRHSSLSTPYFLMGCAAIKNAHNHSQFNALTFYNWSQKAYLRAPVSPRYSPNHASPPVHLSRSNRNTQIACGIGDLACAPSPRRCERCDPLR